MVANAIICLIHQTNYLLDQQIGALERDVIEEGGYSEQLAAARIAHRRQQQTAVVPSPAEQPDPAPAAPPHCPQCGRPIALRTARKGPNTGTQFWGCTVFPDCRGSRPLA